MADQIRAYDQQNITSRSPWEVTSRFNKAMEGVRIGHKRRHTTSIHDLEEELLSLDAKGADRRQGTKVYL